MYRFKLHWHQNKPLMPQDNKALVQKISDHVREKLSGEGTGHDWWHIERVRTLALRIAKEEGASELVVELSALTHDLGDPKLFGGDYSAVPRVAKETLLAHGASNELAERVANVVNEVSFKGPREDTKPSSLEAAVVQDADRLDAIGAIGIGRAFAFGGKRERLLHDPNQPYNLNLTKEDYNSRLGTTINHFYEKLLLIKARLNTSTAKSMAEHRHAFTENFLSEFLQEWEGKR